MSKELNKTYDPEAIREEDRIKKLMFIRIPLRLGKDVFTLGKVSKEREKMMLHMMKGFKQFMKLNDVEAFRACATSAMRDAENGKKVLKKIEKQTGIKLEIIKGQEEAQLLYNNLVEKTDSNEGSFAYIDVGGGSTEVSIIHDGVLAESYSYNMGTLRMLSGKVTAETEKLFKENLTRYAEQYGDIRIIGSGGNINKLNKLARHSKQDSKNLTLADSLDYPRDFYAANIESALKARAEMPWGKLVPEREFCHFVLPVRVNNEHLDSASNFVECECIPCRFIKHLCTAYGSLWHIRYV